jgi:hypothetical protein
MPDPYTLARGYAPGVMEAANEIVGAILATRQRDQELARADRLRADDRKFAVDQQLMSNRLATERDEASRIHADTKAAAALTAKQRADALAAAQAEADQILEARAKRGGIRTAVGGSGGQPGAPGKPDRLDIKPFDPGRVVTPQIPDMIGLEVLNKMLEGDPATRSTIIANWKSKFTTPQEAARFADTADQIRAHLIQTGDVKSLAKLKEIYAKPDDAALAGLVAEIRSAGMPAGDGGAGADLDAAEAADLYGRILAERTPQYQQFYSAGTPLPPHSPELRKALAVRRMLDTANAGQTDRIGGATQRIADAAGISAPPPPAAPPRAPVSGTTASGVRFRIAP